MTKETLPFTKGDVVIHGNMKKVVDHCFSFKENTYVCFVVKDRRYIHGCRHIINVKEIIKTGKNIRNPPEYATQIGYYDTKGYWVRVFSFNRKISNEEFESWISWAIRSSLYPAIAKELVVKEFILVKEYKHGVSPTSNTRIL